MMSRHAERRAVAREFGATDIVEERGHAGVARIKELTNGFGADSVIGALGTQESIMQAIRATRPSGHVGYVGVSHEVWLNGMELFLSGVYHHGGPAPVRRFLPDFARRAITNSRTSARWSIPSMLPTRFALRDTLPLHLKTERMSTQTNRGMPPAPRRPATRRPAQGRKRTAM